MSTSRSTWGAECSFPQALLILSGLLFAKLSESTPSLSNSRLYSGGRSWARGRAPCRRREPPAGARYPEPPLTSCLTLSKLLNLFEPLAPPT